MVSVVQVIDDPNTRSHWHVAEYQIGGLGTAVVLPNKIRHTGFHGVAYDHFDGFYGPELALAFQWRSVPRSPAGHGIFAWSSPSDVDITRGVNIAYWNHDSWLHVFRTADPAHAEVLPSMISTGPTVFRASAPLAGNNFFEVQLLGSDPNRRVFLVVSSKWLHPAGTGGVVVDGTVPGAVSIPVMTDGSGNARQTLELSGDSGALLAPLFNTAGAIVNGERFAFPRILFAQWIWNDLLPLGSPIDSPLEEFDFLDTVLVTHASNALILLIGDR
jgi:hypothetical protein